jgi:hypothetical protein
MGIIQIFLIGDEASGWSVDLRARGEGLSAWFMSATGTASGVISTVS